MTPKKNSALSQVKKKDSSLVPSSESREEGHVLPKVKDRELQPFFLLQDSSNIKGVETGSHEDKVQTNQEQTETICSLMQELIATPEAERERLSKILDLIPSYVVLLNKEGKILYKNKAFINFFGNDSGEFCYQAMRGYDEKCTFCAPLGSLSSKSSCITEWISPKTQRAFRVHSYPFEEEKNTWLILKIGTNVTASLQVRRALDLSASSYRVITDNLSIGIAILSLDLRIKAGNHQLIQWFGSAMSKGARVCDVLHCHDQEKPPAIGEYCKDCPFQQTSLDRATHEKEFTTTFTNGKKRYMRLVSCPISSRKGNVQAISLMLEDITKRMRLNKQLQKVKKLEEMSTLAAGIAHEINQPLSALHLYASGLQMVLEKNGEADLLTVMNRLNLIMGEADKIRSIIASMRALVVKDGPLNIAPISLDKAVYAALSIFQAQLDARNITVTISFPEDLPSVYGNQIQAEQVIINLLSNAVHAIDAKHPKSDLTTANSNDPNMHSGLIRIQAKVIDSDKKVCLSIADSGLGLPSSREKIFDPFFTTKEGNEGMGVGLSIVHGIISQWGGQISATSHAKELGGAEFSIILNVCKKENSI